MIAAARERGIARDRRVRDSAGGCSEHEFIALTGSNGKTTTVELIGHIHREAGLPVTVAGQRRHGADRRCPARSRPARSSSARRPRSSSRTRRRSRPTPPCCSTSPRTTSTATAPSRPTAPPSSRCSPASRTRPSRSRRSASASRTRRLRSPRLLRRRPGRRARPPRRQLCWRERAAAGRREIRPARRPQRQNAMAAAAVCLARGVDAEAVRDGLPRFARRPAPARGGRRPSAASSTSTTPRRRTSPPRRSGSTRSRAACT